MTSNVIPLRRAGMVRLVESSPAPYIELVREFNTAESRYVHALLRMCLAKIRQEQPELLKKRVALMNAMLELMTQYTKGTRVFSATELQIALDELR